MEYRIRLALDIAQLALIYGKISGHIEWHWLTILAPLWLPWIMLLFLQALTETFELLESRGREDECSEKKGPKKTWPPD